LKFRLSSIYLSSSKKGQLTMGRWQKSFILMKEGVIADG
jgi:hypothetical protein